MKIKDTARIITQGVSHKPISLTKAVSRLLDSNPGLTMGEIAKQLPQHPYTRISSNMNYALKRGKLSRRKQDGFYRYYPTSYFLLTHEEPKRIEIPQLKPMAEPERLKWIVAEAQRYFWDTQNDNLRDFINYLKETYRG